MFESWSGRHLFNDLRVIEFQESATAPYLHLFFLLLNGCFTPEAVVQMLKSGT
jgi:hypothetical protein